MDKRKSFTLIELLVVIVIIGILAGVIMISTSSSIDKANFAKAQAFSSTVQNELLSNLVSEWTFDNASNIGEDTWGNNHGTLYGSAGSQNLPQLQSASECVFGTCLKFDGTDDILSVGQVSKFNNLESFTLSAWVNFDDLHHTSTIINKGPEGSSQHFWWTLTNGPSNPRMTLEMGGAASWTHLMGLAGLRWNINEWYYVIVIFDNTNKIFKHYRNGKLAGDGSVSSYDLNSGAYNIRLGVYSSAGHYLKGALDDVRIYDAALSSSQIKQKYIAGLDSLLSKNMISKEEYNQRLSELASK